MQYYEYDVLNIDKVNFSEINLNDTIFDSLKTDYNELKFTNWFKSKQKKSECAFIYRDENTSKIEGFLYLKVEDINEIYNNSIIPNFAPNNRLKVGTFKITKTGYKMGERFLKIIIDNAKLNLVEEIYLTIIENNDEKQRLIELITEYGFEKWGIKNGIESVYVKKLKWDVNKDVQKNFPLIKLDKVQFFLLPIKPEYHTKLLPDCILKNESPKDYKKNLPWMNALRKNYIGNNLWQANPKKGDIIIFYRTNDNPAFSAKYRSVLTGLGIVLSKEKIKNNLENKLSRSALDKNDIKKFKNPEILEFLFLLNFKKRPTLKFLRDNGLFNGPDEWAPRGLYLINKDIFLKILNEAKSDIN